MIDIVTPLIPGNIGRKFYNWVNSEKAKKEIEKGKLSGLDKVLYSKPIILLGSLMVEGSIGVFLYDGIKRFSEGDHINGVLDIGLGLLASRYWPNYSFKSGERKNQDWIERNKGFYRILREVESAQDN